MNIEKQTEFDKIKEMWADLAVTDAAKETIKAMSPLLSESKLRKQLRDTTDARNLMEKLGTPPVSNMSELRDILQITEKGDCLTPYQLERVERVLVSIKRLKDYLNRGKLYENSLAYYEENLDELPELREEISMKIRNEEVDDHASRELARIRSELLECEDQMKQKAEQMLHSNRAYMADTYTTIRNGRICLPVKKEYRLKIGGSVVDKSATGSTLFMEPAGVAKYYEQLQLLKIEEENEVYRILYTLSSMVLAAADALSENRSMVEKLDYMLSKGKLSMEMDAVEPSMNTDRRISLKSARHPLMASATAVPLQFEIGENLRGVVITGPNTGGKTVAIKTVMLCCMMAQCGLHVTCEEADVCMNSSFLCDIGDGQNLSENLSTFSAHITNVLEVLREVNQESLVIMDELGSGTDPTEGMGIAIAILEELRKSGAIFLVTTHYPEVKEYAASREGVTNARMTFDKETLRPTYQMVIGQAGESCAFYIADKLGMPAGMLRVAVAAAYGDAAVKDYKLGDGKTMDSLDSSRNFSKKKFTPHIEKTKPVQKIENLSDKFKIGDSVMVYPEKKIGIVCEPVNEKGVLRVQLPNKKIWINHKRVKLHVAAAELYPEDYDFSILFDTVENRKKRHDMERKCTDEVIESET